MEISHFSLDIAFAVNHCPDGFSYSFERYLYNETSFLQLQDAEPPLSFYILHLKKKRVLARCHFFIKDNIALSPYRSPFGGMELDASLSLDVIEAFIDFIEKTIKKKDVKTIKITQSPFIYSPIGASKLTNCYLRTGFQITHPDLNHHIVIDGKSFEQKIHAMERRKLKKTMEQRFVFREEGVDVVEKIYAFIQSCRKERQQDLNISLEDLQKAIQALPHVYKIFSIRDGEEVIATTIIVVVNAKIAYNFLPASSSAYNQWSPMVFLLKGLYEWCQDKNIEMLDLGISIVNNIPQYSLIAFKERIGGEMGLKCTYSKSIG